jgi:hypothetical protein
MVPRRQCRVAVDVHGQPARAGRLPERRLSQGRPAVTTDEALALWLGEQLDQLNMRRQHLGRRHVDPMTRGGLAFINYLAELDHRRRLLRMALNHALEATARHA